MELFVLTASLLDRRQITDILPPYVALNSAHCGPSIKEQIVVYHRRLPEVGKLLLSILGFGCIIPTNKSHRDRT